MNDTLWVIWSRSVYPTPYQDHDLYFLNVAHTELGEGYEAGSGSALKITPNPCPGSSFIVFNPGHVCRAQVAIYDPSGRLIREIFAGEATGREHMLATGNLSPGVYIVVATSGGRRFAGNLVVR